MTIPSRRKATRNGHDSFTPTAGRGDPRLRREIAVRAAALMYSREVTEYLTAKRKAAKQLRLDLKHSPKDLPSNAEIREQIQLLADLVEGEKRTDDLRDMRLIALKTMRQLAAFRPRLIGSTLTGHIRKGSDIDLHVFTDFIPAITELLDTQQIPYEVEHKRVQKYGETNVFTHIHFLDCYPIELTVYTNAQHQTVFKSSITGKAIERANCRTLEKLMADNYPEINLDDAIAELNRPEDHRDLFRMMLLPLESVKQNPEYHPEGDALYHSLQVFELAKEARQWDIEFVTAALLHDVGKAIDPSMHVEAGVTALDGLVSDRTLTLVACHMDAHDYRSGEMGARAKRRFENLEDFDDLLLLSELDQKGRQCGVQTCSIEHALNWLYESEFTDEFPV